MSKPFKETEISIEPEWLEDYKVIGVFCVEKSMFKTFVECQIEIEDLIDAGKPIPAIIAKRFFDMLEREDLIVNERKRKDWSIKQKEHVRTTMEYFSKYKDYLFSGHYKELHRQLDYLSIFTSNKIAMTEHDVAYSFQEMIASCIHSYVVLGKDLNLDRDGTILYFFEIIDEYCKKRNVIKQSKPYSNYRKRVIAAYLTMFVAGIPLWTDENKEVSVRISRGNYQRKSILTHFKKTDLHQATRTAFND